jgi:hypothetical protein
MDIDNARSFAWSSKYTAGIPSIYRWDAVDAVDAVGMLLDAVGCCWML